MFALPPERVWVSVYDQDDEAYGIWRDVVGVPEERIKRMGAEDNFWASGPTGERGGERGGVCGGGGESGGAIGGGRGRPWREEQRWEVV